MTRLDYIWDVLGDRFSYKSRPIFGDFWGYFDKHEFVNKNEFVLVKYKRISSQSYDDSHLIQISPSKINQVQKRREMHSLLLFIFFLFYFALLTFLFKYSFNLLI